LHDDGAGGAAAGTGHPAVGVRLGSRGVNPRIWVWLKLIDPENEPTDIRLYMPT
jgi:hypothetical protein